ncbi:hypothetical protein [Nocardia sp. NPDC020380]|uniref:hypothetical protein n=1 Tax=Nocardia sp. NPDC020380 TaxID=3364309 RepID=UPI003788220F
MTLSGDDSTVYVEKQSAVWTWQLGIVAVSLLMLGFVGMGATITALADGFTGWSWVAAVLTLAVFGGAGCAFVIGKRRNRRPCTEVYSPDNPAAVHDLDRVDGEPRRFP